MTSIDAMRDATTASVRLAANALALIVSVETAIALHPEADFREIDPFRLLSGA